MTWRYSKRGDLVLTFLVYSALAVVLAILAVAWLFIVAHNAWAEAIRSATSWRTAV